MANAVVFKGLSSENNIKQQIEKIDNSELNNYQDVGIEYRGFSKVKQSGNTYKLLRQDTWRKNVTFTWTNSNADLTLQFDNPTNLAAYNFYITSIVIFAHTDTSASFFIDDEATGINYLWFNAVKDAPNNANFDFSANPLKIDGNTFSIRPVTILGAEAYQTLTSAKVRINFYGFREQKP